MAIKTQREIERKLATWAKGLDRSAALTKTGLDAIRRSSVTAIRQLERMVDQAQPTIRRRLRVLEVVLVKRQLQSLECFIRRRGGEADQKPPGRNRRRW
jgi:hypothetical protein